MNNENKKSSRNRKKMIERKFQMDEKMQSLLSKIKAENKKNRNLDKIENLDFELLEIKYVNNLNKLQSE